jgi:hypothetical protein
MNDQERKQFMEAARLYRAKATSSKRAARENLVDSGIFTKKGNLRKPYKHLCIPQGQD